MPSPQSEMLRHRSLRRRSVQAAQVPNPKSQILSWVMYDWANSAFALTVMTGFFPIFFKRFFCEGHDASFSTIRLNLGTAIGGLCIAALGPILGALADAGRARKRFLLGFMVLGVLATSLLSLVDKGEWGLALAVFILATIGFSSANIFYDSLLQSVAPPGQVDRVSSLGFAVGYLGCAILFALNMVMVLNPHLFGLADKVQATRAAFLTASVWWAVFSIPLLLWVKEEPLPGKSAFSDLVRLSFKQLGVTFRDIRQRREVWLFLLAYWLYIDGVHTFIRSAADLGLSIGIDEAGLMKALLLVQLVAFPSALLFGWAAQRVGPVKMLFVGIGIYLVVTILGPLTVRSTLSFTLFAALQAVPLGALQALSRSYYTRLIPADRSAEYFGFYDLVGKFAVTFGPLSIATVVIIVKAFGGTSDFAVRLGCSSLAFFFIAGAIPLALSIRGRSSGEFA